MMLVWRILGSARSLTSVLPQINSLSSSIKQLQKFMTLPQEIQPTAFTVPQRQPEGDFEFKDVSFRYGQEGYPALYMVSFTAQAGKITVLAGHQGSGKSTAVKLALALYRPQAGRVLWGPYTIQQLDPTFLRSSISYAPERPAVVCGSVREYLLSSRTADDESVIQTAERTGLTAELAAHGKTFDSQISECLSISSDIDRLLSITRAFSAKTSLYIIDEQIFMDRDTYRPILISEIKRAAAAGAVVIAVSNDAEMQRQSDRVIRFDSGKVITIENRRIK
jgi:ABC-type multidrug transport system fused ATPase/permease subunit